MSPEAVDYPTRGGNWTWLYSPGEKTALEFRQTRMHAQLPGAGGTEAVDSFPCGA